jgi:hypothetical protein
VTFLVLRGPIDLLALNQRRRNKKGFVAGAPRSQKTQKKAAPLWNEPLGRASLRQPVIPPAPLTGDAGRGCGDASRAPTFFVEIVE